MSESDEEWQPHSSTGHFLKRPKKVLTKFKSNQSKNILNGTTGIKPILHDNVNSKYLYNFSKQILRIEYPGLVKDVTSAIETLGKMQEIEMAAADHRIKLELRFHPNNKYNKPCSADRDTNPGILIRVKHAPTKSQLDEPKYDYEVIGVTSLNFKFNRMCDFQYLPLVASNAANDNVEYIYEKILPKKLPTLEWLLSKETSSQPKFFIPPSFARIDISQNKLYLNTAEKLNSNVRPELSKLSENVKSTKKPKKILIKHVSIFVNLQTPNVQIPDQPLTYTMELIKEKNLEKQYINVRKLFEERPAWTKVAIQYKTGINTENAKIILPAVAYFCPAGPWRMTWIRYEYNPQKDFNSRIYQTLDYRIRAKEGTKLKVDAKRSYTNKTSLKDKVDSINNYIIEERSYVLRPNYIPPARQMFYQYCDVLLPEIQEMVSRLPKLPAGTKYDSKNGWLPVNFTEQCREIVNKYVMDRVQEELLEDTIKLQQQNQSEMSEKQQLKENSSPTYCSKMLSNIKKGIYTSVNVPPFIKEPSKSSANMTDSEIHTIDLLDEDELEQINADDVVNSIPERMDENSDDEHLSQSSDMDIDLEAVEDVNKMIAGLQEEDEVNVMASFLKETL
ncbi:general transcription factor 3C polypeptide 5 isoform X2 [Anoplophora glabripennis]|uniref:general transcription factor 3C polypeptide 5 isoform X2 n=1 Tax=Anoplophora glabripennis TaxID=217634 RepID=UPI0008758781|nr:general transcription factor 3C polypeptide 5 isoform X2 [Anoplophora glabripennis]